MPIGPQSTLSLKNASGTSVQINALDLDKLFAEADSWLHEHKKIPTKTELDKHATAWSKDLLHTFGKNDSQEVINDLNLKSPEARIIKSLIRKEFLKVSSLQEHLQEEIKAKELIKRRKLAFKILGLIHRRDKHRKFLNEQAVHLIEQRKHQAEQAIAQQQQAAVWSNPYLPLLIQKRTAYSEAAKAIEELLTEKCQEAAQLETAFAELEALIALSKKKYHLYLERLHKSEHELDALMLQPLDAIQRRIDSLLEESTLMAKQAVQLLASDNEVEGREQLEENNAFNLQIVRLEDIKAVISGEKYLCRLDGSLTLHPHDAMFILPRSKKLFFHNGQHYLVEAAITLQTLLDSVELRQAGAKAYQHYRPEILGVEHLVVQNQELETREHNQRQSALIEKSDILQAELTLLTNQLQSIRAAQVELDQQIETLSTPSMQLRPTVTPTPTPSKTATPTPLAKSAYTHTLKLMQYYPTERSIEWLKSTLSNKDSAKLRADVFHLEPGQPINNSLMKSLLKRADLGMGWMAANTPAVKSTTAPYPKAVSIPAEEEEHQTRTAPTPFRKSPFKTGPY